MKSSTAPNIQRWAALLHSCLSIKTQTLAHGGIPWLRPSDRCREASRPCAYATTEYLRGLTFVFLCLDKNEVKRPIVEYLEQSKISFIDVGMDVLALDDMQVLIGDLRVTTSVAEKRDHFPRRVSFSDGEDGGEYARNIQIADL